MHKISRIVEGEGRGEGGYYTLVEISSAAPGRGLCTGNRRHIHGIWRYIVGHYQGLHLILYAFLYLDNSLATFDPCYFFCYQPPTRADPKPLFNGEAMGMSSANSGESEPVHSSQLLAKMRARNNVLPSDGQGAGTGIQVLQTEHDELIVEIRNFIAFKAREIGHASTQEIVDEFGSKLPLTDSAVFRSLLRQICTFVRDQETKAGLWKLKPEFT